MGREVVSELLALGLPVRLLVRHPGKVSPRDARVDLAEGDALKPETLPAAMKGVKAVIHLIGIISETSRVTYEQAHAEATRNLLAAAKAAGVTRWVQMSAIGTRPHARSRYHLTKWAAEESVRQSGLDWTIFRPSLIYGYDERDRLLNLLTRTLSWPLNVFTLYSFPLIDGGEPLVQPVSVREVARCFARAPAKAASIGQTYDLVGPVAFSWREMVLKVAAALGKKGIYETIPIFVKLRGLLWLAILVVPCLVVVGLAAGTLNVVGAELAAALWLLLVIAAYVWRTLILFYVPGELLIMGSEMLNGFAPRELRASEMLKMAVEDNVGDPGPAAKMFDYVPERFEVGVERIVNRT